MQIITGPERRRSWSEEQKRAIVSEAFAPGAIVADIARRADVCAGQIYRWRQQFDALKTALVAERSARQQAEARASGAEAMVAHLKPVIAKLRRERFGPPAERGRQLLDQLELQLKELEASDRRRVRRHHQARPGRHRRAPLHPPETGAGTLPEHLPRERVVIPAPAACPCCGSKLCKFGEDVTETLEVVPRQWKVVIISPLSVEWHPGGLYPRADFIVTNLARPAERVVAFTTSAARRSNGSKRARTRSN